MYGRNNINTETGAYAAAVTAREPELRVFEGTLQYRLIGGTENDWIDLLDLTALAVVGPFTNRVSVEPTAEDDPGDAGDYYFNSTTKVFSYHDGTHWTFVQFSVP